jgi:hypothetical protein
MPAMTTSTSCFDHHAHLFARTGAQMAEKRQPIYRIAITGPGYRRVSELFPAGLFPGGGDGLTEMYRVRINRAWHMPGGMKYVFLSLEDALAVAGWGHGQGEARPDLTRHCVVRVPTGRTGPDGPLYAVTWTATDPFPGPDGRWRVFVCGRREPVLVDDLVYKGKDDGKA